MLFKALKRKIIKKKFKTCGTGVQLGDGVKGFLHNVHLGNNCYIGDNVFFNSFNKEVFIGSYSIIADNVTFITGNHKYNVPGTPIIQIKDDQKDSDDDEEIVIEKDVWIGSNVTILKGVTIHSGAIVGAASVVTKDVPSCTIVAGNPAKFIKNRFDSEQEKIKHLRSLECLD